MDAPKDFSLFHEKSRESEEPRQSLLRALVYVKNGGKALDLGAGTLKDTKYLLEKSFDVTALDVDPVIEREAASLQNPKLHTIISRFEDMELPVDEYDFVSSRFSLPFTRPEEFDAVFEKVKKSLKSGGIFSGQLLGLNDSATADRTMSFHTKEQIEGLLSDFDIIKLKEVEKDGMNVEGPKHWHIFYIIARKR